MKGFDFTAFLEPYPGPATFDQLGAGRNKQSFDRRP